MKNKEIRRINEGELRLLEYLLFNIPAEQYKTGNKDFLVKNIEGTNSIYFIRNGFSSEQRSMKSIINECSFKDEDDVLVYATLLKDLDDYLFELDLWKVDYSSIIRIPESFKKT